jgi:hypothetical protein
MGSLSYVSQLLKLDLPSAVIIKHLALGWRFPPASATTDLDLDVGEQWHPMYHRLISFARTPAGRRATTRRLPATLDR